MNKYLVVVDMQNDFITGSLANPKAEAIVEPILKRIEEAKGEGYSVIYTQDTHSNCYLKTQEGKNLPVSHCIKGTEGWEIDSRFDVGYDTVIEKETFGFNQWWKHISNPKVIELVGTVTSICVTSNALALKASFSECEVIVNTALCAELDGVADDLAYGVLKNCQVTLT